LLIDKFGKPTLDVFFKYAVQLRYKLQSDAALPKFTRAKEDIAAWSTAAKKLFLDRYGTATDKWPQELRDKIPPSRKSESQKRGYVLRKLQQRLHSVAKPG
jgi:hypothetical protein